MLRKINTIVISLIILAWCNSYLPAQSVHQPMSFGPIGIWELLEVEPQLTGGLVRIGLVESQEVTATNQLVFKFVPDFSHNAFKQKKPTQLFYNQNSRRPVQLSAHASIIAGILIGDDPNGFHDGLGSFQYKGVVPQAELNVFNAEWFIWNRVLRNQSVSLEHDVLSISWGTDCDKSTTLWWQRGIDALIERERCVVVAGCGNGQSESHEIYKPAWGYNVLSVGTAVGLGEYPYNLYYVGPPNPQQSSHGPTDDGRAKPEVLALGLCLGPVIDSKESYNKDNISYTSFAVPQVAGVAGLLIDAARKNNIPSGDDPRLIKALILNGANKLIGWHKGTFTADDDHVVPLDYRQGAGLVSAFNSHRQLMAGPYPKNQAESDNALPDNIGWDVAELLYTHNDRYNNKVYHMAKPLQPGNCFKATLNWYRSYQSDVAFSPLPLKKLVLELWSTDQQGNLITRLDYSASDKDNIQHVYFQNSTEQTIALVVRTELNETSVAVDRVGFALAYSDADENWSGDQIASDFNADGIVDEADLARLVNTWNFHDKNPDLVHQTANLIYVPEDINCNGRIDDGDLEIFLQQYGQISPWRSSESPIK
ncbi:MAG: S8 family serine peptidase [Planctomycetes bacterium]|nr:S8 family serine peptidase [Planctomycetota bacterium]